MSWRPGILAALLVWLFLASPAAAGIQSRTDSRGVIHISNLGSAQARPSRLDSQVPAAEIKLSLPESAPAPIPEPIQLPEVTASPDQAAIESVERVSLTLARGQINPATHGFPEIVAAAKAAGVKAEANLEALPVQKVSHEADETGDRPTLTLKPAAAPTATALMTGGIQHHRDAQGVWRITNLAPQAEGAGPAPLLAEKPLGPPAQAESGLPIRRVAFNPESSGPADRPLKVAAAKPVAPQAPGLIRRYQDSKGVIHITNLDPEPPASLPAPGLLALSRASPENVPEVGGMSWALKPAAWSPEGGPRPLAKVAASRQVETTEGGIRRFRDKQGVMHIETVEHPLPPGVTLPPRQVWANVSPGRAAPPANAAVAAPPPQNTRAGPAIQPGPLPAPGGAGIRVTAFKDAKGRVKITNEVLPGFAAAPRGPPSAAAAALEPVILEAAQLHQLPPALIRAVIKVESNFCSWAVSPKGAMGLMQLMPGTATLLGVQEPFNPRENIQGGCRYLRSLLNQFGGSLPLALAAYNAGFQRVINCGYQIPAIKETQNFVNQVIGRYMTEEKQAGRPGPWT